MKNKFIKIILIVLVGIFALCLARDFIIKTVITSVGSNIVGAPIEMGGFSLSILGQSIKITNFKMYSPDGFPHEVMVDIPEMAVACDVPALLKGKIHLKNLVLDLKEMGLVKNKEGKLNADSLKIVQNKNVGEKQKQSKPLEIQMDMVELKIGRVVSRDYSVAGPPLVKVYDVGVNKKYKNITSAQQLAALIVAEPLKAAGIQGLAVYGVGMLTGVAALPVAAVFFFAGKDFSRKTYDASWDRVFSNAVSSLKESGRIKSENKSTGVIVGEINGAQVILKMKQESDQKIEVTVSARRFMMPQPEIAGGIIYRLSEKLK